jgi:F-type H+-transporting ATPase subunit gamma
MSDACSTPPAATVTAPKARPATASGKTVLLVFCAEQGFAGAFSERILDSIGEDPGDRQACS